MGWRAYLEVKKNDKKVEIAEKKNFVPDNWLKLASSDKYKEDCPGHADWISPRFEIPAFEALQKLNYFFIGKEVENSSEERLRHYLLRELEEGSMLVIIFGEVVCNEDIIDCETTEHYLNRADMFHNEFVNNAKIDSLAAIVNSLQTRN